MGREKDIEKHLREKVTTLGGLVWKFTSPGTDGVPDRIVVMPDGRLIFVELKARYGVLAPIQKYQIGQLLKHHQQVVVIRGEEGLTGFLRDLQEYVVSSVFYDNGDSRLLEEVINT